MTFYMSRYVKFAFSMLAPLVFLILILVPPLPGMYEASISVKAHPKAAQITLGLLFWVVLWWVCETVPLGLTGLLPALILPMLGVLKWKEALPTYLSPIIWIFMGAFALANAFRASGLDKRVVAFLSSLYRGKSFALSVLTTVCLPTFFLSMIGSITGAASIMLPITLAYLSAIRGKSKEVDEMTLLLMANAATAGALLFLISTPPNLIGKAVVEEFTGYSVSFFDWFIFGTPQAIFGLITSWLIIIFLYRKYLPSEPPKGYTIEKSMSFTEKSVLSVFLLAIALWTLPGFLSVIASATNSTTLATTASLIKKYVPEYAPAILILILLPLIRQEGKPVLPFDEMLKKIDWNTIFLFGGGLLLGKGIVSSGLSEWIASVVRAYVGSEVSAWLLTSIVATIAFGLTQVASNTATANIFCPIAATIALGAKINPIIPILTTAMACSIACTLPASTPPMAIVYSTRKIRVKSMLKVGVLAGSIRLIFLLLTAPYLLSLVIK
mgnify:CR=1 FL=1